MGKKQDLKTAMPGTRDATKKITIQALAAAADVDDSDSDNPAATLPNDEGAPGSSSDGDGGSLDDLLGDGDGRSSDGEEGDEDDDLELLPDKFGEEEEEEELREGADGSDDDDDDADDDDDDDDIDGGDLDIGDGDDLGSDGDLMMSGDDDDGDADDEDGDDEGGRGRQEARRRSGSLAGTAAAAEGAAAATAAGFTQGAKGASFAKAFGKLLEAKAKAREGDEAPILAASKSLAKREAEEDADATARRESKRVRLERRRRGHIKVPRRGEDPVHDLREKQLGRLATRGVVLLFNAIATAQKQAGAGASAGKKPAKLNKASFLAQLKAAGGASGTTTAGAAGGVLAAAAATAKGGAAAGAEAGADAPGWKVLRAGFSGLSGGGKMKDWDRKPTGSDDEDAKNMGADGGSGSVSESDGEEGW